MTNVPVEAIRRSNRFEMTSYRKKLKNEENDLNRELAGLRLEPVDVSALASKLKTKSEVTVHHLQQLKNILLEVELNIFLVLNTHGALKGLVREFTGVDVKRQVEAAGCLCNLALADQRGCIAIISAAGVYLVAALDSQNLQLAITCAWTLGNLMGSGRTACQSVEAAGAVPRLCAQLTSQRNDSLDRADAALYALTLFAHTMGDQLSKEHLDLMIRSAGGARCDSAFRLYYILSCHEDFSDPHQHLQNQIIRRFPDMMRIHNSTCVGPGCCEIDWAIRTLANMESGSVYYHFLMSLRDSHTTRKDFLDLAKDPLLKNSVLWLLGNMRQGREHLVNDFNLRATGEAGAESELGNMSDDN